ncbi:MAG: adenylosuccinate lyase [Candidatus Hadarchaeales archaeon]
MAVHPIEGRYGSKEMREIFTDTSRFQRMLDVEAALAKALAALGMIPASDAAKIASAASLKKVSVERISQLEKEVHHETMAMVLALAEAAGPAGRYVHFGATSNDILDTAMATQIRDGLFIIEKKMKEILRILLKLAVTHKNTLMVGRTHGQHAVPITFGMKVAIWAAEIGRHLERLQQLKPRVLVGKMSGAVGTGAAWGEKGLKIQELVMKEMGLLPAMDSTQIVQRDRFAELITFFGLVASTFDKIAREIRNLQRTEIGEVSEPFAEKQIGSSTMPQKRNPIRCEKICGIARVLRSQVSAALENVVIEHERDLTNSSCERILLPQSFLLLDEILSTAIFVLQGLRVFPERMEKNLEMTRGLNMAEALMIELTKRGMNRQEAHKLLRRCTAKALLQNLSFFEVLRKEREVTRRISEEELSAFLQPSAYLGNAKVIVEKTVRELSKLLR